MKYFQSGIKAASYLKLEWTDQHGCGGNENSDPTKQNCLLVIQYMCQTQSDYSDDNLNRLRDGLVTTSQAYTNMNNDTLAANQQRKQNDVKLNQALNEPWEWYDSCRYRQRNTGLFTADQVLRQNEKGYSSAIYTRQNPNGNRNGYECAEERDYYPYFHPSVWTDIAVLTSNDSLCNYYRNESFNQKSKYLCVEYYDNNVKKHWSRWNTETECVKNGGQWTEFYNYLEKSTDNQNQKSCESAGFKWAVPYDSNDITQKECLILPDVPICQQADWTRSNHLGNTRTGEPASFNWKLPYYSSKKLMKCVLRIRYNITTDDYDPFATDSNFNNEK